MVFGRLWTQIGPKSPAKRAIHPLDLARIRNGILGNFQEGSLESLRENEQKEYYKRRIFSQQSRYRGYFEFLAVLHKVRPPLRPSCKPRIEGAASRFPC